MKQVTVLRRSGDRHLSIAGRRPWRSGGAAGAAPCRLPRLLLRLLLLGLCSPFLIPAAAAATESDGSSEGEASPQQCRSDEAKPQQPEAFTGRREWVDSSDDEDAWEDFSDDGEDQEEEEEGLSSSQASVESNGTIGDDWTVQDIWEGLGCDAIFEKPRPIHGPETWAMLRGVYVGVVGRHKSTLVHGHGGSGPAAPPWHGNGFLPRVVARHADGKGRGVFAAEPIRRGTLVWTAHDAQTARFDSGPSYRRFLASIPVDVACDVVQWAYVQDLGPPAPDGKDNDGATHSRGLRISVDLNEGSYMNTYDFDDDEGAPNVGCPDAYDDRVDSPEDSSYIYTSWDCRVHYVALRDIKAGEELLVHYGDFAVSEGWVDFGL